LTDVITFDKDKGCHYSANYLIRRISSHVKGLHGRQYWTDSETEMAGGHKLIILPKKICGGQILIYQQLAQVCYVGAVGGRRQDDLSDQSIHNQKLFDR
jgi:hypothetical protein